MTHEIGLDLVNLLGTKNILGLTYAPSLNPAESSAPGYQPTAEKTQLGFLPIFYYKIDFKAKKKDWLLGRMRDSSYRPSSLNKKKH